MAAMNMDGTVAANPSAGSSVLMSPFSGPRGAPFEARSITSYSSTLPTNGTPVYTKSTTDISTGALNTGIGFGSENSRMSPGYISASNRVFTDDYTPGVTLPGGTAATTAILTAIGGGKSTAAVNGIAPTVPYAVQPLLGFGNGGSRDAGAGPIFTGFATKSVTATGTVANAAVIETGWLNRSGGTLVTGQHSFGSATAASAVVN